MRKLWPRFGRQSRIAVGIAAIAAILSLGLFVSSASATVMKYVGLDQLVEISDIIVQAKVVNQKTYFDETQQRIVTDTTFEVARSFLGGIRGTLTIQQWGGTYKGRTAFIPGDAHFDQGEEAIIFLAKGPNGVVALSALGQSKFAIIKTDKTTMVSRDLSDIAFLISSPEGRDAIKHLPGETRPYASFVAEVQSLVAGIKGGDHE